MAGASQLIQIELSPPVRQPKPEWLRNHDINIFVQYGIERHPELRDVPSLLEVATTSEGRQILAFYVSAALLTLFLSVRALAWR